MCCSWRVAVGVRQLVCGSGVLSCCSSGVLLQWCTVACAVAHESTSVLTHTMFLPPFFSSSPLPPLAPRRDAQRRKAGGAPHRYPRRQRREPFTSHVRVPPVKKATTVTAGAPPERWALLPHAPQVEGVRSMRRGREERRRGGEEEKKRRREEWRDKNEKRGEKRKERWVLLLPWCV